MFKMNSTPYRLLFLLTILTCVHSVLWAQCPPPSGTNTLANAFDLGTLNFGMPNSTIGTNNAFDCYIDSYAGADNQASPDAFYKIKTGKCTDRLDITTCSMDTDFDTYIHVLDAAGVLIMSNDDDAGACGGGASSLSITVMPDKEYYIVVEGKGAAEGTFDLTMQEFDDVVFTTTATSTPSEICVGANSVLTATSMNGAGIVSYEWTGLTTMNTHLGTPYNINGAAIADTDAYQVVATDANGCSAEEFTFFTVNTPPEVTPSPSISLCASATTVSINANLDGSASAATWSYSNPGGGTLNSTTWSGMGENYTLAGNDLTGPFPKNIVFTITTDSPAGCVAATGTVTVTITANPDLVTTNPAAFCAGGSVDLATTVVDNAGLAGTKTWYPTEMDAMTETNALGSTTVSPTVTTTYWVRQNTPETCFDIASVDVTVNPSPTITLSAVLDVCAAASSFDLPYTATTESPNQYSITAGAMALTGFTVVTNAALTTSPIVVTIPGGSATGTYDFNITVKNANGCIADVVPFTLTITPAPSATISYSATAFCSTGTTTDVTQSGTAGGSYSAGAGLAIDATTGQIDIATSTAGTYTVTYSIPASAACPIVNTTTSVTITALPTPAVAYTSPSCTSGGDLSPSSFSPVGGSFTIDNGGTINAGTGVIAIPTTVAGSYVVIYTVAAAGGCPAQNANAVVTITNAPSATITYTGTPFCKNIATANVTQTGTAGGTYSGSAGLVIDATTGQIDIATSTNATHTITYTLAASGGCPLYTATTDVTINPLPTATIAYSAATYCSGATPLTATITRTGAGLTAGTYAASPAGLSLNATTGTITLATSTAGIYTVTHSFADAVSGCTNTATTTVTINAAPTPTIVFPTFCYRTPATVGVSSVYSAYNWTTSDVATNSTTATITNTITLTPPFTYRVTVTDANGCTASTSSSVTAVMILPRPTIAFAGSVTACQGQAANLSVNLTDGTPWTFTYAIGGVAQPPVTTAASPYGIPVNTAAIGVQNFTITALSNATCSALASDLTGVAATATVSAAPVAPTVDPNPLEVCSGASFTLTTTDPTPAAAAFTSTYGFEATAAAATSGAGAAGVVASSFSHVGLTNQSYTVGTAPTAGGAYTNDGWNVAGRYWEYTMTAATGYTIDLSQVTFNLRRSGTGPAAIGIDYSVNGGAFTGGTLSSSAPTSGSFGAPVLAHSANFTIAAATSVVFRIKATTLATAAGGTLRIDNLNVTGASTPVYTVNYFSDAALTTSLGTGLTYTATAGGSTPPNIYVNYTSPTPGSCPSATTIVPVTVNSVPALTATDPAPSVCAGGDITLEVTLDVPLPTAPTYTWTGPNTALSFENINDILGATAADAGSYTVEATNVCGTSTATIVLTVNDVPVIASTTYVCETGIVTVVPDVAGTYDYTLVTQTGGAVAFPATQNTAVFNLGIGTTEATFTISSGAGCTSLPYSEDFTACPNGALPVKLIYFKGAVADKNNQLDWETATEQNSEWFMIEASTDGVSFKEVGRKRAAGNSNVAQTYGFTHLNVPSSMYYRLRILDADGQFEFSNTVYLRRSKGTLSVNNVFPNPTEGLITVQYEMETPSKLQFTITDELGRQLATQTIKAISGVNNQTLDLADFPGGVYLLLIDEADGKRTVRRIIKQ